MEKTEKIKKVTDSSQAAKPRRSYSAPRVLSAEQLEAAAATCAPPAGGFGKHRPNPCGILGS